MVNYLEKFYDSREEDIQTIETLSNANYDAKQNETKEKGLQILTPKQMLQRLPVVLAQVKAGNNSESLLNEIRQIVYSLYQSKGITKKSVQQHNRIYSIKFHAAYKRWKLYS